MTNLTTQQIINNFIMQFENSTTKDLWLNDIQKEVLAGLLKIIIEDKDKLK